MRDIKFRAWNNSTKHWIDMFLFFNFIDGKLEYTNKDDVIIEQYTGINDKNGVEIYEGDIVKTFSNINKYTDDFANDIEPKYKNTAIAYENCAFRVTYKGKPDTILNNNGGTFVKYMEVVGNIHENADLLEETK